MEVIAELSISHVTELIQTLFPGRGRVGVVGDDLPHLGFENLFPSLYSGIAVVGAGRFLVLSLELSVHLVNKFCRELNTAAEHVIIAVQQRLCGGKAYDCKGCKASLDSHIYNLL